MFLACFIECVPGEFGEDCEHTCEDCKNGAKCNRRKNGCDCTAGWVSLLCDQSCPEVTQSTPKLVMYFVTIHRIMFLLIGMIFYDRVHLELAVIAYVPVRMEEVVITELGPVFVRQESQENSVKMAAHRVCMGISI